MLIVNIHERSLACSIHEAAFLIDDFATINASLWPGHLWPREPFDGPLQIGAKGEHGGTQYLVDSYEPGRSVKFKFIAPKNYLGYHQFELLDSGETTTLIRHTVELNVPLLSFLKWRCFIQWVHDALIEDAFDCAQEALDFPPAQRHQWPKRVYLIRHLLGGTRLLLDGCKSMLRFNTGNKTVNRDNLRLNPICNVIIGFRNYTTHSTRSRYISFSPTKQPQMSQLLLDLSMGKVSGDMACQWPEPLVNQLIDYGLFVELESFAQRIKSAFKNLLNENRFKVFHYKDKPYVVTSFIFMAFNSQLPKQYIRETVVLPSWVSGFSKQVFQLIQQGVTKSNIASLPATRVQKLVKHGVLIATQDYPTLDTFFGKEARLDRTLLDYIPKDRQLRLIRNQEFKLNQQVYFIRDIPEAFASRIYDREWLFTVNPSIVVEDCVTKVLSIYWLTSTQEQVLKALLAGTLSIDKLDEETQGLFAAINVLEQEEDLKKRALKWQETIQQARQELSDTKIIRFKEIISPVNLAMARKYLRHLTEQKYFIADNANGKTKERYWQHRDNFTFFIQSQMCTVLNQLLPEPVKIGHNAITLYKPGAILPKHIDDVIAFSWVMSIPLDTQPETDADNAWPIFAQAGRNKVLSASLGMGDAVLMNPQMPHWREQLEGHSLGIVFLWFIPTTYKGYVNGHWID